MAYAYSNAPCLVAALLVLALPCVSQTPARRKPAPKPAAAPVVQQPGDPANKFPLESLKIAGNQLYTAQQILAVAGLKVGTPVAKDEFEQARKRLTDTGAFESVGLSFGPTADGKGYAGTFEVVEVGQLYPFRFEGLPDSDRHLRDALKSREPLFADRIPGTKQLIDRFASDLQAYLGDSFKDKVKAELAADKPGELAVVFRPATTPPAVAEVEFTGNKVLPASTLHNTLAAVATGLPYREETIRGLLDTSIRPLYDGTGTVEGGIREYRIGTREERGRGARESERRRRSRVQLRNHQLRRTDHSAQESGEDGEPEIRRGRQLRHGQHRDRRDPEGTPQGRLHTITDPGRARGK